MKLKFKKQEFQEKAVNAVADLFKGQEKAGTTFSIVDNSAQFCALKKWYLFSDLGVVCTTSYKKDRHLAVFLNLPDMRGREHKRNSTLLIPLPFFINFF